LYFKGGRGVVELFIENLVLDSSIVSKMKATDAASIGYYFSIIGNNNSTAGSIKNERNLSINYNLNSSIFNIMAINRDGKLIIEDTRNVLKFNKKPSDLYSNKKLLEKFSASQALYIGYLAGLSSTIERTQEKKKIIKHLQLVR
jgi:hypothetical protein